MSADFAELATLINLNSHSHNKAGIDANAAIFSRWMEALGYTTKTFHRETIGNHVLYSAPVRSGPRVLLLGHLDTVFPPGTFTDFAEDEQWIYGPGVCDMKGGNYVALCALRNVLSQQGQLGNIDMLLVSDEETGSDDSKTLTAELAPNYDIALVFEAAGKNNEVVIARKGIATYFIDITGKGAHAGNHYSDGVNANLAAAHLTIHLTSLTDLDKGTTVNVGKIKGGLSANTISPQAQLVVEARFTSHHEKTRILTAFNQLPEHNPVAGSHITVSGGLQRDVMQPSDKQQQLLQQITEILGYPLPTERRGGVSDANVTAGAGVATLDGFGPFGDGDHTIHERASKQSFNQRIDEVSKILAAFNQPQ
ncbi:M20 family metallopeptidase [Alteromonas lipolytica]|uniref:Peptidase M20 n=1 Tax=Alteromonas lipolytica TaxID=1856405 RepID=A0A1E8FAM0_9ALTE|nr:M20 family metallopeptidase [Alteromonas lipolytica]OFI32961.1 peptidase M20 [Alteromonas lipolytica]GGF63879.1 peptidase M20 [Alteromonas lipolytica]